MNHDKPIFSQSQEGATLEAYTPTFRERDRSVIQQYLTPLFGAQKSAELSENITGSASPVTRNVLGLGLADVTPFGVLYGGQESGRDFMRAYRQGSRLGMAGSGLGFLVSAAEAFPLTKFALRPVTKQVKDFLGNINRKSVADESNLTIPEKPEVLMTSPGPKTIRDDEINVNPPKGISRRGVLQGIAAVPIAGGVLGELPISNIASKVTRVKVPSIVPKSLLTKLSVLRNKMKLTNELQLRSKGGDKFIHDSEMRKFLKGEFEPERLSDIGVSRGDFLRGPAGENGIDFLFKNKADKKKFLELDRKRQEAGDKAFGIFDGANEAQLQGKSTAGFDPNVMIEQQELEHKMEVEMFKFLRDAMKENRLSDDFFRKSGYKPMLTTRIDNDPLDSATYYYRQRIDAKKLLGDGFDEIPVDELKKMSSDASKKRDSLSEFVRGLPREVPTPPKVSAEMKKLMEEREVIDAFIGAKYEPRAITAAKRQDIIKYQKENDFTDEEMLGLMERSVEKAMDFEEAQGRFGRTELTDQLLDDGKTKSIIRGE